MTSPVYLFDLTSRQAQWLAARQTTISGNVANANTPGYRARNVEPFADVLDKTKLTMAATNGGHIGFEPSHADSAKVKKVRELGHRLFQELGQPRAGTHQGR